MSAPLLIRSAFLLLLLGGLGVTPTSATSKAIPDARWMATTLQGTTIYTLAVDPTNPAIIYAGGFDGLYKSTNRGNTWRTLNVGLPVSVPVYVLAIDPLTPTTLYAGLGDSGGVYKSVDGGSTWISASTGITGVYILTLAIHPLTPTTLYAGAMAGGLFVSTDAGGTWQLTNLAPTSYVSALRLDPQMPNTLYVGRSDGGEGNARVFKSTDGGDSWLTTTTGLAGSFMNTIVFDPLTTTTLYGGISGNGGGIFKSTNSGQDWSTIGPDVLAQALVIDADTLYVASASSGVFTSTHAGGDWYLFNAGLTDPNVYDLALAPGTSATLYAATGSGVFYTQPIGHQLYFPLSLHRP